MSDTENNDTPQGNPYPGVKMHYKFPDHKLELEDADAEERENKKQVSPYNMNLGNRIRSSSLQIHFLV